MIKKISFLLLFFGQFLGYGQFIPRTIVNGQIISDSTAVEQVTVFNISSNKGAVTDAKGKFSLYAKPSDTLVFSSVVFKSKKLILTELDFKVVELIIKLEEYINELDEVIVTPKSLTGNLEKDAANIKVTDLSLQLDIGSIVQMNFEDDFSSSMKNTVMPSDLSMPYALNLMAIGKKLGKLLFKEKKKESPIVFTSSKRFAEAVRLKFSYAFFTETLALKPDEIGLFLDFCESDPRSSSLLQVNKEIELIDFLIEKNKAFKIRNP